MKNIFTLLFFTFLCSCSCSSETISENDLQNGDFIFVEAKQENLSGAINRVTKKSDAQNFDHVGLIEIANEGIFVLHACSKLGSNREPLGQFYSQNTKNNQKMVIYRLKKNNQNAIQTAILKAESMLGKPYNWTYILNEESYYCSDFIERIFREDSIFKHIPMNFKNPQTDQIDPFWIEFYQKLNFDVPQGQPGTNPNQLASSEKLLKIGNFGIGDF